MMCPRCGLGTKLRQHNFVVVPRFTTCVLPKVRSALCAASQLPGEGATDVEDAPAPTHY